MGSVVEFDCFPQKVSEDWPEFTSDFWLLVPMKQQAELLLGKPIILRMTYGIAAERWTTNRLNFHVCHCLEYHGRMQTCKFWTFGGSRYVYNLFARYSSNVCGLRRGELAVRYDGCRGLKVVKSYFFKPKGTNVWYSLVQPLLL